MNAAKQLALKALEAKEEVFLNLSDEIWGYAELSLKEFRSADAPIGAS